MKARKIRDEAEARRCLAEAAASGRPRAEWARAHGVDARSLNAWRLNLGRPDRQPPLRLVELVATQPAPEAAAAYRIRCGVFEVDASLDFDEASLGRLLRVVAASC